MPCNNHTIALIRLGRGVGWIPRYRCGLPPLHNRNHDAMSSQTKLFVGIAVSLGMGVLCFALWHWQSADLARFVCYLAVAVLASSLKVQLPGIDGTMSVNFLFILLGVMELSLPETL